MSSTAKVKDLLRAADAAAALRAPELAVRWVRLSCLFGSMIPNGSAMSLLQEVGRLDLLLRALEDDQDPFADVLAPMSVTWVSLGYEVVRALHQRHPSLPGLELLLRRLELVRIPLLKFEIAHERKNKLPPLELQRYPPMSAAEPTRRYDKAPKDRAYRPLWEVSPAGVCWGVLDSADLQTVWVSRRSLADEMLALDSADSFGAPCVGEPAEPH